MNKAATQPNATVKMSLLLLNHHLHMSHYKMILGVLVIRTFLNIVCLAEMSKSPLKREAVDEVAILLTTVPGAGDTQNTPAIISAGPSAASCCCDDEHHRKLAICSIVCGISCIGIKALISSVEVLPSQNVKSCTAYSPAGTLKNVFSSLPQQAERTADPERAITFSKEAKKFGIISIVVWVSLLALTPILLVLVSYLLTLGD